MSHHVKGRFLMAVRQWQAPTREDLLALAKERFLEGERLDIAGLAEELGISRATAYRWAGNADELIGNVVAVLAEETFRRAVSRAHGTGAERIIDAMARGMRTIVGSAPYRHFLESDPQRALRIVASKEGASQGRMIELHQQLLEEEIAAGNLRLPIDAHSMAYALVRTAETFMYADLIAGEKPDISKAAEIMKLLIT
jgi:AcrR family transcriptional regulator